MKRTGLVVERSALCAPTVQAASQGLTMASQIDLLHGPRRPYLKHPSLLCFSCDMKMRMAQMCSDVAYHVVADRVDAKDAKTSMLLMHRSGRRSMKGGLFGRAHEHTQQPCKRLPKTLSSCARLVHLCVVVSRQLSEHVLSPRWSQCVETHVQTSI